MSRRLSDEVRSRIRKLREQGLTVPVIAQRLSVSRSVVHKVLTDDLAEAAVRPAAELEAAS